ncbi:hypothetical protein BD410DRAFT_792687 [Rickenella mellea]|uniref:Uncharacterized protein n=1 Tax=Rickenella mellea TaxID=50990 RepID=A0A4Y7PU15_9AGAM|nr:hypothetical protein BD410DRAFT_792915 [Rickenella mellea]TDL18903.1 hypothetical protein BD410DRAFT_792687 [Rickenella mellea]
MPMFIICVRSLNLRSKVLIRDFMIFRPITNSLSMTSLWRVSSPYGITIHLGYRVKVYGMFEGATRCDELVTSP